MATVDEKSVLQIPEPFEINHPGHPGIPESLKAGWRETYRRELKNAAAAQGGEPSSLHHQMALQKANEAHLQVRHPETYEEALALPKWQYLVAPHEEDERDGNGNATGRRVLRGMTIDGKALRRPRLGRKLGPKGLLVPEKPKAEKAEKPKDGEKPKE